MGEVPDIYCLEMVCVYMYVNEFADFWGYVIYTGYEMEVMKRALQLRESRMGITTLEGTKE